MSASFGQLQGQSTARISKFQVPAALGHHSQLDGFFEPLVVSVSCDEDLALGDPAAPAGNMFTSGAGLAIHDGLEGLSVTHQSGAGGLLQILEGTS
jgi:hypothetical protein